MTFSSTNKNHVTREPSNMNSKNSVFTEDKKKKKILLVLLVTY